MTIHDAKFVAGYTSLKQLPDDGRPEIAFAGRSNVGKSSLLNMLLGRKNLARTSGQPGKTRELNFYLVNDAFYLVDLPGYGYAKISRTQREAWVRLISSYLSDRDPLRLLVHLVDARHEPMELDRTLMQQMQGLPFPYVVALSKTDKISGNERARSIRRASDALAEVNLEVPVIATSAETGRGRDELLNWIDIALT